MKACKITVIRQDGKLIRLFRWDNIKKISYKEGDQTD